MLQYKEYHEVGYIFSDRQTQGEEHTQVFTAR